MADIKPSKVRTPIQLLAAWLAGLTIVNGSFLTSENYIHSPSWASGLLVIASVLNVPIFLASIFLLQTRFRPEMQEDEYYSKYLERTYSTVTARTELVEYRASEPVKLSISEAEINALSEREPSISKRQPQEMTEVEVNDLLPRFGEMLGVLKTNGIGIVGTFGSSSSPPEPPKKFIITVSDGADMNLFQAIVQLLLPYGLEGTSFTDADKAFGRKRIYVGAYNYDKYGSRFISVENPRFFETVRPDTDWQKYRNLVLEASQN